MKQLVLCIAAVGLTTTAFAQPCTPDPLYADSLYGVWPDTTENFVTGYVGVPYLQTLNLIVPEDAGVINPLFTGVMLDSVSFDNIDGLPPGLSVACASQSPANCTYMAGVLGCGIIEGTPTTVGTYPLTLNVTAYTFLFGGVQAIPQSFTGYQIIIDNTSGTVEMAAGGLGAVHNVPNPFSARTSIEFQLTHQGTVALSVFNLLGEEIWKQNVQGKTGTNRIAFEAGELEEGIYLYKVRSGSETFTGRMVLHR
ncbi:MAG: T9SS type A sorting domain-containing protein [Flavobacteriales bacterium]